MTFGFSYAIIVLKREWDSEVQTLEVYNVLDIIKLPAKVQFQRVVGENQETIMQCMFIENFNTFEELGEALKINCAIPIGTELRNKLLENVTPDDQEIRNKINLARYLSVCYGSESETSIVILLISDDEKNTVSLGAFSIGSFYGVDYIDRTNYILSRFYEHIYTCVEEAKAGKSDLITLLYT